MPFKKGQSGNPKGRKKGTKNEIDKLRAAVKKIAKEKDKPFWELFVEQAYKDNRVLVAVAKKLLPDKKEVEQSGIIAHVIEFDESERKILQDIASTLVSSKYGKTNS